MRAEKIIVLIILLTFFMMPILVSGAKEGLASTLLQNEQETKEKNEKKESSQEEMEKETPSSQANGEERKEETTENMPTEASEEIKGDEEDIVKEMPEGKFINPEDGSKLKGEVRIKFKVENAIRVEFYLRRPESLVELYLGLGASKKKGIWEYSWQTTQTPNGSYFLFPKIVNEYGEYEGKKISVYVENEAEKKKEEIQSLQKGIEETEKQIQAQEQEIEEEKEKVKEEMISEVEEVAKRGEEMVEEAKKEEIKSTVQRKTQEFEKEADEGIEKAVKTEKEEEREKIKEEIRQRAEEVIKPIIEASKEEKKFEVQELEKEMKQKISNLMKILERILDKKKQIEEKKKEIFSKDSDADDLPDYEELRLGTNPLNPDSDNDGFLDGSEIALGFDPLKPSPADKIKYQEPRRTKAKVSKMLKVKHIEVIKLPRKGLKIIGESLPYSFVTVYIYSFPVIVITKTDDRGRWEYILDKPLADGQHTVYAAITNNRGEIEEVSEPFVFMKTGEKIFRLFQPSKTGAISPAEMLKRSFLVLIIAIVIFALGIAFIIIGFLLKEKAKK
jgi:NADH:ubiquinone oxidoreductase subunit 3 (subunit A)